MMLFILIHESMYEWLLMQEINDGITFLSIIPTFITHVVNWTNINFYGSLLPIDLLPTNLFNTLDDTIKLEYENKISEYLYNSFELLKTTWNLFYSLIKLIDVAISWDTRGTIYNRQ